ncbi:MAG: iron ABC transporter permease [Helicobacteraceae bacterium]|nr:iron ABC transporter permease [Helicobacteraceae bacterium]
MKKPIVIAILSALLALSAFSSLLIGRYDITPSEAFGVISHNIFGAETTASAEAISVINIVRAPRIFMCLLVGAALSASGAAYQGLFRNPLVSPDILGVSSGAAVGASIAIILSLNAFGALSFAFIFGLGTVFLVSSISLAFGGGRLNTYAMILAGVVFGSLCNAVVSLLKYLSDAETKLPEITFWLMGTMSRSGAIENAAIMLFAFAIGFTPLYLLRWRINLLSFGEEEARSLGVNARSTGLIIIFSATLLCAASVSICGVIGWIGLIVPHIARGIVGADYRVLLPASALLGSILVLWTDTIARSLSASEIPLGILTAFVGAPIFIYLLYKNSIVKSRL